MKDKQITSTNQSTSKNEAWVNVTVTVTYDNGETKQISNIQPKVKG
jgi:hypothetical protein